MCQHEINDEQWRVLLERELAMRSRFGCAVCYGDDPASAWEHTRQLERVTPLVDESDFIVHVVRCKKCGQHFFWITTEVVDWAGGDDAQFRRIVPVTAQEAAALAERGDEPSPGDLAAVAVGRRYLRVDWPTGRDAPRAEWTTDPLLFVTPGV